MAGLAGLTGNRETKKKKLPHKGPTVTFTELTDWKKTYS